MAIETIHLVSASPRRREILEDHGFKVKVVTPVHGEELSLNDLPGSTPEYIVSENSKIKSSGVILADQWVLAGDTIVVYAGKEYGKPSDIEQARQFLRELSGNTHTVYTGFCLKHNSQIFTGYDLSHVTFKSLNDSIINNYLSKVHVLDKAGAYAVQNEGMDIIETYKGSFFNIMGLCIEKILETIQHYQLR